MSKTVRSGEPEQTRVRAWLGRALALVLVAAFYVGFVKMPWPVEGWYHAPEGEVEPGARLLLWEGKAYQYGEHGGRPIFLGWYETTDDDVILTNVQGGKARLQSYGWGGVFTLLSSGETGFAYREWSPRMWWKLRAYPLPEPPDRPGK